MPPMIGQITLFPYDFDPAGWMSCDGRPIAISENETLFSLLNFTFGGDQQTFFNLPNLQAAAPRGCRYCMAMNGGFQSYDERLIGDTLLAVKTVTAPSLIECKGGVLPVNQNMILYHYLGNRFGGDNARFNLPDLHGKAPANCHYLMSPRGQTPEAPSDQWYVGEILLLPYDTQSQKLALCNGQTLSAQQHGALSMLLRDRFGGNNQQFALPDLRTAAPPKFNYYIALGGAFPSHS